MNLCLLTYDSSHLKTEQIALNLWYRGFETIDFLAMPFKQRPDRSVLLSHRPHQFAGAHTRSICDLLNGRYHPYDRWISLVDQYDYFLVCGSNLIDPEFASSGKILNLHAGLIPQSRGLDSFKWAIFKNRLVGNTLHIIDEHADAGNVLAQDATPVFEGDSLETFARRHYEREIWLLSNFDTVLENPRFRPDSALEKTNPTMRMPLTEERELDQKFIEYKANWGERT